MLAVSATLLEGPLQQLGLLLLLLLPGEGRALASAGTAWRTIRMIMLAGRVHLPLHPYMLMVEGGLVSAFALRALALLMVAASGWLAG